MNLFGTQVYHIGKCSSGFPHACLHCIFSCERTSCMRRAASYLRAVIDHGRVKCRGETSGKVYVSLKASGQRLALASTPYVIGTFSSGRSLCPPRTGPLGAGFVSKPNYLFPSAFDCSCDVDRTSLSGLLQLRASSLWQRSHSLHVTLLEPRILIPTSRIRALPLFGASRISCSGPSSAIEDRLLQRTDI